MEEKFDIEKYNYHLPEERIARFPLKERSRSKLLFWNNGKIAHHQFQHVPSLLPSNSLLVFNDTKVIAARLHFKKETGAHVEVFLLHPEQPTKDISTAMTLRQPVVWACMIGNKRKWKNGAITSRVGNIDLTAAYKDRDENLVELTWSGDLSFAEVINAAGKTPLPPYLNREPVEDDITRYQTVYSKMDGAVAAPTAGLHFTDALLNNIRANGTELEYLTLHVSAGTFKPVEEKDFRQHDMHSEQIVITKSSVQHILEKCDAIIAVGTTSLRILESLYWFGVRLIQEKDSPFFISRDLPYELANEANPPFPDALKHILSYMDKNELSELHGETEIYIYPGYRIRTARGLFTNFHLPKSTLLLLISTFTGERWQEIYDAALEGNYRFLSYGDSSLLLR